MIKVNQSAKEKIKSIEFPEKALGIRILVRSSGCSGLAYVMEYCYKQQPDDLILDNLFIDPKSLIYLKGSELQYTHEKFNEGFEFINPNVTSKCGCGESFYVV